MKPISGTSSTIKIVLFLSVFLLLVTCVWKGYKHHLQIVHAKRTLMFLKSVSSWQAELLQKNQLVDSYIEFPPFTLYTELVYHSQDTFFRQIVKLPKAYLLALAKPEKLDTVPYGVLVEMPTDKAYCLAHKMSRSAERFCQEIGATLNEIPVQLELQNYPEMADYSAYPLPCWEDVAPLIDEPVDAWRYLNKEK